MSEAAAGSALARLWPWFASVASGALLALSFPPWNVTPLAWVALSPLLCAIWFSGEKTRRPARRAALLGYVAGLVFFTTAFHWLGALGVLFQQPWLYSLPFLLSLIFGGYFAFWTWFLARILAPDAEARRFRNSWQNLAIGAPAACAWVLHEWVRSWFLSGFGWNNLAVTLHRDLPMIQIAELTGAAGLSWLIAFVNVMIFIVVRRIVGELGPQFGKRIRWEFSISVAIVVSVFAYGVRALLKKPAATEKIRVAAVQPNVPQELKFSGEGEDAIFQQLGGLTELAIAANEPDLLLWPESATPRGMFADKANYEFVMKYAELAPGGFLLGTVEEDLELGASFNSAKLFTRKGTDEQTYRKIHLVPFGEYLPLRPILGPIAGELVPGDFAFGDRFTVFELPGRAVRLAPLICFEDTLGDLTRRFVKNGANLLVNITNDGWFLKTAGANQHLANATLRAVENRRPLIRCTNTGVTCLVTRTGRIEPWLKPFEQGFAAREVEVPIDPPLTFYSRHGEWFAHLSGVLTLFAIVRGFRQSRSA